MFEGIGLLQLAASLGGVAIGIVFGAVPGMTATMGVAIFLPFTFGMNPVTAFALLLGIYVGGTYGGSITAILIRTPGSPAAAATVLDGYPLREQGKALEALSLAVLVSFIGGIFSCLVLILVAPQLAAISLKFGPPEYFAVGLFGISIVTSLSSNNIIKGVISGLLGLLISTIGMDPISGVTRFTFGSINMMGGIYFVAALIGLFAVSEVLNKLEKIKDSIYINEFEKVTGRFVKFSVIKDNFFNLIRSSAIGTVIGIIPGTGGGVASWLSYNEAKRVSKNPDLFGKGAYEGVVAAEAANNAVTGGTLVPLLTLGIPGDVVTAIMLGALMIQGLTPGPMLFVENREVVTGIYVMLIIGNIFLLILGLIGINLFVKILKVPSRILMPVVMVMCFVGTFSINNNVFDIKVALILGIMGYLLDKGGFPLPPMLLGIILASIIESNFRRALTMSQGDYMIFITRPICLSFIIISIIAFLWPIIRSLVQKSNKKRA